MARRNANDDGTDRVRITDQFRTRVGMAYELRGGGSRLTVMITQKTDEAAKTAWFVEASSPECPGAEVSRSADTKAEALRLAGLQWGEGRLALGLPPFDWGEVAKALSAVRAI